MPDDPSVTNAQDPPQTDDSPANGETHISPSNSNDDEARNIRSPDKWRYPDDYQVPWLRGKTADEAAQVGQQMFNSMVDGNPQPPAQSVPAQPAYQPQPQPQPQPVYAPAQPGVPTADDYITNPEVATNRAIDAKVAEITPQFAGLAAGNAQVSLELVKQGDLDTWNRWGPEIMSELHKVDQSAWSVQNLKTVFGIVKSRHLDEITTDMVNRRLESMANDGTIIRAGAAATSTSVGAPDGIDFDMDQLPERYRQKLEAARTTPEVLKEFLMDTEVNPKKGTPEEITLKQAFDEWMKDAQSGDILLAGD